MNKVELFRGLAHDARIQAAKTADRQTRAILEDAAATYQMLADNLESQVGTVDEPDTPYVLMRA